MRGELTYGCAANAPKTRPPGAGMSRHRAFEVCLKIQPLYVGSTVYTQLFDVINNVEIYIYTTFKQLPGSDMNVCNMDRHILCSVQLEGNLSSNLFRNYMKASTSRISQQLQWNQLQVFNNLFVKLDLNEGFYIDCRLPNVFGWNNSASNKE